MTRLERISSDPAICHGQPTIRGLRTPRREPARASGVRETPRRLLVVITGNITNDALLALFDQHLGAVVAALQEVRFVELGPDSLVVHDVRYRPPMSNSPI